ncbi:MAG: pyruvate, phosphate dikinase, partial [Candidatus Tectomicrobia bacterium]|nr:pyruvate, phosphate dikinase [Candidatus Tectomicrobia bacterium]
MGKKYVYFFGAGRTEGDGTMRNLLGGKGAGLAEMASLGIPVPPGFTISTEACIEYFQNRGQYPAGLWEQVEESLAGVEGAVGVKFGDPQQPLLVSVRSGARASMPGMMDTVLNLGLNDATLQGLIRSSGNERFAWDSYRRLLTMFGDVVLGIERKLFDEAMDELKAKRRVKADTELNVQDLQHLVEVYQGITRKQTGQDFPQDPKIQLRKAIDAVFNSWNNERAITYRRLNNIPGDWGTAVNVQAMVFGNMGEDSGTGVAFTRNPATGENKFYGEYLMNAQGEDVVAGIRTPESTDRLMERMPEVYQQLLEVRQTLEHHYRDMQDIEFTIQKGKLYLLQTRAGKRTAAAAVRAAIEMAEEGLIDRKTAVLRVEPEQVNQLLHPRVDPKARLQVIARGLAASPGAAVGKVVFTAEEAERLSQAGERVVLVRTETSPEDIGGMNAAQGILTARGGLTSHAAVVARGMGKCCIVGCGEIRIDEKKKEFSVNGRQVRQGEVITLNGTSGEVILGEVKLVQPELGGHFARLIGWADEFRRLGVRANADTPHDAQVARDFGAQGIGLCRTEHMFF